VAACGLDPPDEAHPHTVDFQLKWHRHAGTRPDRFPSVKPRTLRSMKTQVSGGEGDVVLRGDDADDLT
jgi:hypothetical protein